MTQNLAALKKLFQEGRHAEAIAGCEALAAQEPPHRDAIRVAATMNALCGHHARALELLHRVRDPANEDADVLFNIAQSERALKNFDRAEEFLEIYTRRFASHADGWASRAEIAWQRKDFEQGLRHARRALELAPTLAAAWTLQGHCQQGLGRFDDALTSYATANRIQPAGESFFHAGLAQARSNRPAQAIESFTRALALAPGLAEVLVARGDAHQALGREAEAVADYRAALALNPSDGETLKKATMSLLERERGDEALALCRELVRQDPTNITARLGAEWVKSLLVPLWHIPMMNEPERNQAYHDGLKAVVAPDKLVFEVGTGSGLVAMMAARLGAREVVTCEGVNLVARTAEKIVARNGLQGQVKVVAKPSFAVQIPTDLPRRADVLVHEVFSSELLGEHVLPAIEDARERLLAPGGQIMPAAASIMVALVGGELLGRNIRATESFGFDVRDFNAIYPAKRPLYREDLRPELLGPAVEAFRFDFTQEGRFEPERKRIEFVAERAGTCWGLIQWIRIEMAPGVQFENHPLVDREIASWQQATYGFDEPLELQPGQVVRVIASHDRARPWFELDAG